MIFVIFSIDSKFWHRTNFGKQIHEYFLENYLDYNRNFVQRLFLAKNTRNFYWQNNLTKNKFWQKATVFDQKLILTKAVILTKVWFRPKILGLLPILWRPRFNSSNFGFSYSVSVRMTSFNNISSRRESILSITYARAVRSHSISVPVQSERLLLVGKSSNF